MMLAAVRIPRRLAGLSSAIVALLVAGLCASVPLAQQPVTGRALGVPEARIVDAAGAPLPRGAVVKCRIAAAPLHEHAPNFGMRPLSPAPRLEVGDDGRVRVTPWEFLPGMTNSQAVDAPWGRLHGSYAWWLIFEHVGVGGLRERAIAPLKQEMGTLALEPEALVCAGSFVDSDGGPLPLHFRPLVKAPPIVTVGELSPLERLDPRVVRTDVGGGRYEVWGWPFDGELYLRAGYGVHGPSAEPVALEPGDVDLDLVLPAVGTLHVRCETPRPFPEGALFASLVDVDTGLAERRRLLPHDATNLRVRTGSYRARIELHGVEVADLGTVRVDKERQAEAVLDLRARVRLIALDVVDAGGAPIPTARVRVTTSPDEPLPRQTIADGAERGSVFLVATTTETVDVEASDFGSQYEARTVADARDGQVIALRRKER